MRHRGRSALNTRRHASGSARGDGGGRPGRRVQPAGNRRGGRRRDPTFRPGNTARAGRGARSHPRRCAAAGPVVQSRPQAGRPIHVGGRHLHHRPLVRRGQPIVTTQVLRRPDRTDPPGRRRITTSPWRALDRSGWAAVSATLLVNIIVLTGVASPLRALLVLPVLLLMPGLLTLRAMAVLRRPGADTLLHALAISLLWLLAISLLLAVVPIAGAMSTLGCLVGFDVVVAGLAAVVI